MQRTGKLRTDKLYHICIIGKIIQALANILSMKLTTLPEKCVFCRKMQRCPNPSPSALTISMPTSAPESRWKISHPIPDYPQAICPACSNRTSVYPSAIISAKKKSKKHRIFCAFPILLTSRLQTIYLFLPRATLSRLFSITLV